MKLQIRLALFIGLMVGSVISADDLPLPDPPQETCYDLFLNVIGYTMEKTRVACEPDYVGDGLDLGEMKRLKEEGQVVALCYDAKSAAKFSDCLFEHMDSCGNWVDRMAVSSKAKEPSICECNPALPKILSNFGRGAADYPTISRCLDLNWGK